MVNRTSQWQELSKRSLGLLHPNLPGKAQIGIEAGDDLYREIRIDSVVTNALGQEFEVKERCGGRGDNPR